MVNENRQDAPLAASDKQEAMESREPLTLDEVINLRTKELAEKFSPKPPKEDAPPKEEQAPAEEEPAESEQESIEEAGESDEDVLSKYDLESMSEDDLAKLGNAIRSKIPKRFGELTKRAKTAEERIAELEAKLAQKQEQAENPLERKRPLEQNPFKDIGSIEGLQEQWENFKRIEEWADDLLDENDTAHADDIITEQDGKSYTKKEVKQYLKKAKQAREKFLPARLTELQALEQAKQVKVALDEKAKAEFDWYSDTESTVRHEYDLVLKDPRVALVKERVPELGPQFEYILAHAVHSMSQFAEKQKAPAKKAAPKLNPPSNPDGGAARASQGSRESIGKELQAAQERLLSTNSYDDFVALRSKQRLQRTR